MNFFLLALIGTYAQLTYSVFIPNGVPHLDSNGSAIDAHEGHIVQWTAGGEYYWYGLGYGGCMIDTTGFSCAGILGTVQSAPCGFQVNHTINVFTSPDLLVWTFQGEALPQVQTIGNATVIRPLGIYDRPKVIYHPTRNKYILWVVRVPVPSMNSSVAVLFDNATFLVAESDTPVGPFQVVTVDAAMHYQGDGDFDILVDGTDAYIAYRANSMNLQVAIEKLNANFTDAAQPAQYTAPIAPPGAENPALFKYGSYYYLTFGNPCCFCYQGNGVQVYTSSNPMGPWTDSGVDIAISTLPSNVSRARAQQTGVFRYATPNGTILIWAGDQWGLTSDGTKGHVFQYWVPMTWGNETIPLPQPLQVVTGFDTNAPFNLQPYLTGFCDKTEVALLSQVLVELGACNSSSCYETVLGSITPDCAQCIITNREPALITKNCIPPDYRAPAIASPCDVAESTAILQLLVDCPNPDNCMDRALQVFLSLSPTCGNCLVSANGGAGGIALLVPCFPAGFVDQFSAGPIASSPVAQTASPGCTTCPPVNGECQDELGQLEENGSLSRVDIMGCTDPAQVAVDLNNYGIHMDGYSYGCTTSSVPGCNNIQCSRFVPPEAFGALTACPVPSPSPN